MYETTSSKVNHVYLHLLTAGILDLLMGLSEESLIISYPIPQLPLSQRHLLVSRHPLTPADAS